MSDDPELKRLAERLDTAFATTRPRRGFEDELWAGLERRRPFWARLTIGARRVNLLPYAGALAALVVVVGLGGLLVTRFQPGGGASTTLSQSGGTGASKQSSADSARFGPLPRPALSSTATPAVTAPETAPAGSGPTQYQGPVTVTAVTAGIALPAQAPVARYKEPTAADADRLAAAAGAAPAGPAPAGALGRYSLSSYTVIVFPTDTAQGAEPRLVIAGTRPPAATGAPDESGAISAAQAFLGRLQIRLDGTAQGPLVERRGALLAVLWARVVGATPSAIEIGAGGPLASWQVTVAGDLTVTAASVAVPLPLEYAQYALADAQQLARAAMVAPAGPANLPRVVLDTAQLVYVVAGDGAYGYFEPAVMYTGHFTQNGVQYEKRVIVPAVAAQDLR